MTEQEKTEVIAAQKAVNDLVMAEIETQKLANAAADALAEKATAGAAALRAQVNTPEAAEGVLI